MKLNLIRKTFTEFSTISDLKIDGKFFCYALEDVVRDKKIDGETAIPYGTYEVITNFSTRFKKVMPLIKDVPGFKGVRCHAGNTEKDTDGCILLGMIKNPDWVGQSKVAFSYFMVLLQDALNNGERVFLTITKEA